MNTIKTQDIIEHLYNDDTGDAKATIYRLFPGVEVAYISVHTSFFDFTEIEQRVLNNYIGFHYCMEGRIEQEVDNEYTLGIRGVSVLHTDGTSVSIVKIQNEIVAPFL